MANIKLCIYSTIKKLKKKYTVYMDENKEKESNRQLKLGYKKTGVNG